MGIFRTLDGDQIWTVEHGDCRDVMRRMPEESIQCVVTSPPYFGLRSYEGLPPTAWADGWEGCLGDEPDPRLYVAHMVEVFDGIKRILKPDGVVWLNLGDSFVGARWSNHKNTGGTRRERGGKQRHSHYVGCKSKDLMLMPHRTTIALQEAGWWVRMDVCWEKPNCMPDSCKDRPTKSHEYVFLLAKSAKYYYDHEAVKEPSTWKRRNNPNWARARAETNEKKGCGNRNAKSGGFTAWQPERGRNRRSVWTVATKGFKGEGAAHFAVMPEALAEICVLAGSRPGDSVFDPFCGAGTTGLVAATHGRKFIGAEASPKYVEMAANRISRAIHRIPRLTAGGIDVTIANELNNPRFLRHGIVDVDRMPLQRVKKIKTCLYNEDCCDGMQRLPDACAALVVADPPYGIGNPKSMYNRKDDKVWGGYEEAPTDPDGYLAFTRKWLAEAVRVLRPGGSMYIFSGWTFEHLVKLALASHKDLYEVNHIIWKYQFGVNTKRKFVSSHYHVFFWAKDGARRTFNLECRFEGSERTKEGRSLLYKDLEDVWVINRTYKPGQNKNQNELPEAIIEKILAYSSDPGNLVLDPFLGGFTTARVARRMGRRFVGFEINPEGFDEKAAEVLAI